MLRYTANTNKEPVCIFVGVEVSRPTKIRLLAIDPYKKGAVYIDRVKTVQDEQEFEIRLPQSPNELLISVMAQNVPNDRIKDIVRVYKLEKGSLQQHLPCISSKKVASFLKFAKQFSENAGILSTGRYQSDDKEVTIDYLPQIVHEGKTLTTPARISNQTGRMEISKKAFVKMTIPMRMAILCHEYSHFYLNEIQKDEIEADLNALTLYMGLGYPVIEAHKAFLETFHKSPTESNKQRYIYLKTFIDNFEQLKYEICFPN